MLVNSQVKPGSSFRTFCEFDLGKAVVAAGAAAEKCNEKFGDSIDPAYCVAAVAAFYKSNADLKCRSCGWAKNGKCTQHGHAIDGGATCPLYLHVNTYSLGVTENETESKGPYLESVGRGTPMGIVPEQKADDDHSKENDQ